MCPHEKGKGREIPETRLDIQRTHFFAKYTSETDLPLWMACELMTFGDHPVAIRDDCIFGLLSVLRYLLRQTAPASAWPDRLKGLLAASPHVPLADMGFPAGWEQSPVWQ